MRRKPSAAESSESPTELIARISAEDSSPASATGRHRLPRRPEQPATPEVDAHVDAEVTVDQLPAKRSTARRLAPLAVGAVAMLVATTVATVVQQPDPNAFAAPELSSAIIAPTPSTSAPAATTAPPAPTSQAAQPTTEAPRPQATTTRRKPPTTTKKPPAAAEAPAGPAGPAVSTSGDGTQAGSQQGWKLVGGDEFNGGKSSMWGVYNGAGHAGNGKRTPSALTVENGALVIRGDSAGNTGGMAWKQGQRFGKWEMRAKFPKGDAQYHPVLILWPTDVAWPKGGEIDFAETTSASNDVSFFLHYGASNSQKYAKKTIDISQWHNYAVEWVDGRITGYIDGEKWFESTDRGTMPPSKMHPTIQLDYFPSGGNPKPTEMYVDYMRVYQ